MISARTRFCVIVATVVAALFLVGLVASCGEPADQFDLPEPKKPKAPPPSPGPETSTPAPAAEPAITPEDAAKVLKKKTMELVYDPINKTDPFKPFVEITVEAAGEEGTATFYELRFYRLVGVLGKLATPMATFEDPNSKAYILHERDRIGKEGGVISRIHDEGVVVTQEAVDWQGRVNVREIEIFLHPETHQEGFLRRK